MDRLEHERVVLHGGLLDVGGDERRARGHEDGLTAVVVAHKRLDEVAAHVHHLRVGNKGARSDSEHIGVYIK